MPAASAILKGLRVVVDVRMSMGGADVDCSAEIGRKLSSLGARVCKRIGKETTHVVWLNGSRAIRDATLKRNDVILVGPSWVEACVKTTSRVLEGGYFPVDTGPKPKGRRQSLMMEPRQEDVFDEATTTPRKKKRQSIEVATPSFMRQPTSVQKRVLKLTRDDASDDDDIMGTVDEEPTDVTSAEPPPKRARVQSKANTWSCVKCTFDNPNSSPHCGICGTLHTAAAPAPTTSPPTTTATSPTVPLKELKESLAQVTLKTKANSKRTDTPMPSSTRSLREPKATPAPPVVVDTKPAKAAQTTKRASVPKSTAPKTPTTKKPSAKKAIAVEGHSEPSTKASKTKPTTTGKAKATKAPAKTPVSTPKSASKVKAATTSKAAQNKPSKTVLDPSVKTTQVKAESRPKRFFIAISGADELARQTLVSTIQAIDSKCPLQLTSRVVEANVAMTHVVATDASKRTMKVLFGIARGAWIVSDAWVYSSLEAGAWLPEAAFQIEPYNWSPEEKGNLLRDKTFHIAVAARMEPPKETLHSLISAAGGKARARVTSNASQAQYCICYEPNRRAQQAEVPCVTPKWLFDSIASNKLLETTAYAPKT
ncbi:hypothetical protein ACHHYP_10127 [Achlya hypogyna]|uniref:RanBP2-type domain-containing protein n=1 Tax=Achlya hypogyna TaxID=1202772 RepID=A0A1V9ZI53_ACHHY|nr:hypothetical protein ACHHYP_10127 [Achlya hypogyna]